MLTSISWQLAGAVIGRGGALLALALLSRSLSVESYGAYAYLLNSTTVVAAVLSSGASLYLRRATSLNGGIAPRGAGLIVVIYSILAALVSVTLVSIAAPQWMRASGSSLPIRVSVLVLILSTAGIVSSILTGAGRFKTVSLTVIMAGLGLVISVALFLPSNVPQAVACNIGAALFQLLLCFLGLRGVAVDKSISAFKLLKESVGFAIPATLYGLAGAPVYVAMQAILIKRTDNLTVAELLTSLQIANISQIAITQILSVFAVRMAQVVKTRDGAVSIDCCSYSKMRTRYVLCVIGFGLLNVVTTPIVELIFSSTVRSPHHQTWILIGVLCIGSLSWFQNETLLLLGRPWMVTVLSIAWAILCITMYQLSAYLFPGVNFILMYACVIGLSRLILLPIYSIMIRQAYRDWN